MTLAVQMARRVIKTIRQYVPEFRVIFKHDALPRRVKLGACRLVLAAAVMFAALSCHPGHVSYPIILFYPNAPIRALAMNAEGYRLIPPPRSEGSAVRVILATYEEYMKAKGLMYFQYNIYWLNRSFSPPGRRSKYSGLTYSPKETYVRWDGQSSLADTSLAHELMHNVMGIVLGDSDGKHVKSWYWKVLLSEANRRVRVYESNQLKKGN